jgi:hypothetical protein
MKKLAIAIVIGIVIATSAFILDNASTLIADRTDARNSLIELINQP